MKVRKEIPGSARWSRPILHPSTKFHTNKQTWKQNLFIRDDKKMDRHFIGMINNRSIKWFYKQKKKWNQQI